MTNILTLQITSADNVSNETQSCVFNEKGGSIGRKTTNIWVLFDNEKHLSSQHAFINYNDGVYTLTDTSTNGVFINNSSYSVGRGNTVTLRDTDVIKMGPYRIIAIIADTSSQPVASQISASDNSSNNNDDFFKEPNIIDSPTDNPVEPKVEQAIIKNDDFFDDDFFKGNEVSSPSFMQDEAPASMKNNNDFDDDFFSNKDSSNNTFTAEKASSTVGNDPFFDGAFKDSQPVNNDFASNVASSFKKDNPFDDDFFKEDKPADKMPVIEQTATFEDNADVLKASNPFNTNFFEESKVSDKGLVQEVASPVARKVAKKPNAFVEAMNMTPPIEKKEKEKEKESSAPLLEKVVEETRILRPSPGLPVGRKNTETEKKYPQEYPQEPQQAYQQKTEAQIPVEKEAVKNTSASDVLIQFLVGAGIEDPNIRQKIANNMDIEDIGKLFRIAIEGTVDLLRSRTDIKNEMRIDATMIGSINNNPLKFSINLEDTLIKLMLSQKKVYMTPERALTEAYNDMRAHQIAVMAGMEAILSSILGRFHPEKLVARLEKESPITANIPLHRQARLWKRFELLYETIEDEAEEDFNRLLGGSFTKAYEQQMKGLKSKK